MALKILVTMVEVQFQWTKAHTGMFVMKFLTTLQCREHRIGPKPLLHTIIGREQYSSGRRPQIADFAQLLTLCRLTRGLFRSPLIRREWASWSILRPVLHILLVYDNLRNIPRKDVDDTASGCANWQETRALSCNAWLGTDTENHLQSL